MHSCVLVNALYHCVVSRCNVTNSRMVLMSLTTAADLLTLVSSLLSSEQAGAASPEGEHGSLCVVSYLKVYLSSQ